MKLVGAVLAIAVCGCSFDPPSTSGDAGSLPIPDAGDADSGVPGPTVLRLETGTATLPAQTDRTDCYYTTLDVAAASGVRRWTSTMTAGVSELVVHVVDAASQPDGTRVESCATPALGSRWAHFAQTPTAEHAMPAGVGTAVAAQQHVVIEMRLYNPSDEALEVGAAVEAELLPPGTAFQPAGAFVAVAVTFAIPPNTTGYSVERSCPRPAGSFFALTTHSRRFSVRTEVRDGASVLFSANDWEDPGEADWRAPPHHTFAGDMVFACDYQNPTPRTVTPGDSPASDEACAVIAWRFPAEATEFCVK